MIDLSEGERLCKNFVIEVVNQGGKRMIYIRLPSKVQTCDCSDYKGHLVSVCEKNSTVEWVNGQGSVHVSQVMIEAIVLGNRIARQLFKKKKAKPPRT